MKPYPLLTGTTGPGSVAGRSALTRISVLLPLLLLLISPRLAQAQFEYSIENGAVTITGYTGPGGDVVIPETIEGLPVTSIGPSAFYHNSDVISVLLPDSMTSIGNAAFAMCWNLASITIPDSVTSIGWQAYYHCLGLTHVTIGSGVMSIGDAAFRS